MPVAHINVLAGHPRPVLKQLLREVAQAYANILDSPIERLQVWITEIDPELYAIGGVPADELLTTGERSSLEIPLVRLVVMENRPTSQIEQAIVELTAIVARVLGTDPERVRVEAQPVAAEWWGIGGVQASLKRRIEMEAREAAAR